MAVLSLVWAWAHPVLRQKLTGAAMPPGFVFKFNLFPSLLYLRVPLEQWLILLLCL